MWQKHSFRFVIEGGCIMTGETVVYKNEMNLVPLRRFTATEINLFFAMCNKLK